MNSFRNWIDAVGGASKAGRKIGVTDNAVYKWLDKTATPRISTMKKIVKLSKGKVSIVDIISLTTKN